MRINADFTRRVVVRPSDYRWVDSPMPGVERMMLDRIGEEVARATSLVRYAPNSTFSEHVHGGGEEFLVLEGVFGDEHRDYPEGTYVRNPIGTRHTPRVGEEGCTIFVKLHQFEREDSRQIVIDTRNATWERNTAPGVDLLPLHQFAHEKVWIVHLTTQATLQREASGYGTEIFVIDGSIRDAEELFAAGSWLRVPGAGRIDLSAGEAGAVCYIKTGHLPAPG